MAQKTIDAIKNKREEKAVKQQLEEEKKRINKEKSVMRAKEVLDRRRVQLGIIKGSNEQQLNEG
jgi:AmiR/NasT family two-component response regulator